MSEALSREALLEYVKKQKQKIKKLEHELSEEREKSDANAKISNIPDLVSRATCAMKAKVSVATGMAMCASQPPTLSDGAVYPLDGNR